MGKADELNAEWRQAVEGMKFFDEPVQDMEAESLLRVIGYLVVEKRRFEERLRNMEIAAIRIPASGGFPVLNDATERRDGRKGHFRTGRRA